MSYQDILGHKRFACGVLTYVDRFKGDNNARIVIPVLFDGIVTTTAIVDTGAPWCILSPEEAEALDLEGRADCLPDERLIIRGSRYAGRICRVPVELAAERGLSLSVEANVFIPWLDEGQRWPHPNFIGLGGFLNAIRFAVDPALNLFYFGPAQDED